MCIYVCIYIYFSFFPFLSVSLFLHALVNNCISFSIFLLIFNKSSCIIIIMKFIFHDTNSFSDIFYYIRVCVLCVCIYMSINSYTIFYYT